MSYEAELLVLALLLYLYDSSVLLYSNQGVLICDRAEHWSFSSGWAGFVFAGRSLCMLNPFTPHRPSFRLDWEFDTLPVGDPRWSALAKPILRIQYPTLAAAVALFVLLPIGLLSPLGAYAVIPALVMLYGSIVLALIQLHRLKILLGRGKRFLGFAFECLACPPFGVNMMRRITLADRIAEPLPVAGARLLDASQWTRLQTRCLARLDEAERLFAEESSERVGVEAQKVRLKALRN